jgi:hypothetical protein
MKAPNQPNQQSLLLTRPVGRPAGQCGVIDRAEHLQSPLKHYPPSFIVKKRICRFNVSQAKRLPSSKKLEHPVMVVELKRSSFLHPSKYGGGGGDFLLLQSPTPILNQLLLLYLTWQRQRCHHGRRLSRPSSKQNRQIDTHFIISVI